MVFSRSEALCAMWAVLARKIYDHVINRSEAIRAMWAELAFKIYDDWFLPDWSVADKIDTWKFTRMLVDDDDDDDDPMQV